MKFLLLSFLFLSPCALQVDGLTNGQDAERNQFPYQIMVRISYATLITTRCSGTILSPTWILTAASCSYVELGRPLIWKVAAGVWNYTETGEEREIADFIMHPDWEGGVTAHNIGLLKVAEPFTFSESIQPIPLPEAGTTPEGEAIISGWGTGAKDLPQYAQVPIISYDECAPYMGGNLHDGEICTGPVNEDRITACQDDEGGPLAQGGVVVGVIKWQVTPCGYYEGPVVYTKVSDYIDFILEHVDDLPQQKKLLS